MTQKKHLSRRSFLGLVAAAAGSTILAACKPEVVEKVVKETVIKEVEKVKEVEKIVTATPAPVEKVVVEFWGMGFGPETAERIAVDTFNKMTPGIEIKPSEMERDKLIAQLEEALAQVRALQGLLPICSSCKRIRDYAGRWRQMEEYVSSHSTTEFTHGLCLDCRRKLYPDFGPEE